MTTWKLKIVEGTRVVDQFEFKTTSMGYFNQQIEVWSAVAARAKDRLQHFRTLRKHSTAEEKRKLARVNRIREAMSQVLTESQLNKLIRQLMRYNYQHKVWAPFITEKERQHAVEDGTAQRKAERENKAASDQPTRT